MRTVGEVALASLALWFASCSVGGRESRHEASLLNMLNRGAEEAGSTLEERRIGGLDQVAVVLYSLLGIQTMPYSPSDMTELSPPRPLKIGSDYMERRALCVLAYALRDPSSEVRRKALVTAIKIGGPASCLEDGIRACALDSSHDVQVVAAKALYFVCGDAGRATDLCVKLLSNDSDRIRERAAYTLVQMGSAGRGAKDALARCRDTSESVSVSRMCQWALDQMANEVR